MEDEPQYEESAGEMVEPLEVDASADSGDDEEQAMEEPEGLRPVYCKLDALH